MKYKPLRVLSYDTSIDVEKEYKSRIEGSTAYVTNLIMSPDERDHKSRKRYPVFFSTTMKIMSDSMSIIQNSNTIKEMQQELPAVASQQFFIQTLSNEIMSTNEIEGVHSSQQEVGDAIVSALTKTSPNTRFHSLAYMYLGIQHHKSIHIGTPEEIRSIWEEVTSGEVKKRDMPDGKIFRAGEVFISDQATAKTLHYPYANEEMIIKDINELITFMNNDEVPFIIKAIISHFYFEYIHPFYDGNGRTGRYLACAYLGKKLDYLTGVNLSYSISRNKAKYYKGFEETENPRNFGDATMFVETMMDIIIDGQKTIISTLTKNIKRLESWETHLKQLNFSDEETQVIFYLIQSYLFSAGTNVTLDDNKIMEMMVEGGAFKTSAKKAIDALEANGWTILTKERPKIHALSDKFVKLMPSD